MPRELWVPSHRDEDPLYDRVTRGDNPWDRKSEKLEFGCSCEPSSTTFLSVAIRQTCLSQRESSQIARSRIMNLQVYSPQPCLVLNGGYLPLGLMTFQVRLSAHAELAAAAMSAAHLLNAHHLNPGVLTRKVPGTSPAFQPLCPNSYGYQVYFRPR
jgi:hypothetical protein